MREIRYTIPEKFDGVQAQVFLRAMGISRRVMIRLKQSGGLIRSGAVLRTVDIVHSGEEILLRLCDESGSPEANPGLSAEIMYEDEDAVVFNKPPYMPVHPSQRHHDDTLANLFAAKFPGLPFRPINRLDRNTSGLCVCAKNQLAAAALSGTVSKVYFAITESAPPGDTVNAPVGRVADSVIERCVTPDGKPAITHYVQVNEGSPALLKITLETGRTHQIRVHMAHMGFPLLGDDMYGGDCSAIKRQALHCGEVSFISPVSGNKVTVTAPLPQDMAALIDSTERKTT